MNPKSLNDVPGWRQRQLKRDLLWFSKFSPVERNLTGGKGIPMTFRSSHPLLNRKRGKFGSIRLSSKTSLMIFLILLFSPSFGSPQSSSVEEAKFLSPLENSVVREINMARTAPKDYASLLEQSGKYYDKKILRLPGEPPS